MQCHQHWMQIRVIGGKGSQAALGLEETSWPRTRMLVNTVKSKQPGEGGPSRRPRRGGQRERIKTGRGYSHKPHEDNSS